MDKYCPIYWPPSFIIDDSLSFQQNITYVISTAKKRLKREGMKLLHSLPHLGEPSFPTVLTIGMFDGMHLGHTMLLAAVKQHAESLSAKQTLITFSNHPSSILRPEHIILPLCTVEHRLHLIKQAGIDSVVLLPFTKAFAEQSAELFLQTLCTHFSIVSLILGSDATLGKNRAGDREAVKRLAEALQFSVKYLEDCTVDGERVSSSKIRDLICKGELESASRLLGRKYSIYSSVIRGDGRGRTLGFPTANIQVQGLCLPPRGVYAATCRYQGKDYSAVANLGIAPTVKDLANPLLEVHILDNVLDLYEQQVEVFLNRYIRPEKRFDSLESLKAQIAHDINQARQ
jgi:riboflavin kinase/FMN adenylyltransferase